VNFRFDDNLLGQPLVNIRIGTQRGAIAMITTIRSIGQFSAENFNDSFTKNLLSYNSNQYTSIAEALRISKIVIQTQQPMLFYIGDPALMLAIPKPKIRLTK
jgi:hypothetical protein